MSHAPKSRWPRFTLRTLFVLATVICIWLGWTLKVRHDRAQTRRWMRELGLVEQSYDLIKSFHDAGALQETPGVYYWHQRPMPFCMWLIGDEGIYAVGIPGNIELTPEQYARIERDFPEAGFKNVGGW